MLLFLANSEWCLLIPLTNIHSRPQRPRSFWSPRIATSGLVQRHSVFEWLCKHNRFDPETVDEEPPRGNATANSVIIIIIIIIIIIRLILEPIKFVRLYSEHAQSDGKSVNRGLPVLDPARGRDSWC